MSRGRAVGAARRITEDPELLTRTSWVDAGIAYRQVCKVRPTDEQSVIPLLDRPALVSRRPRLTLGPGRGLQLRGVGEFRSGALVLS